MNEEKNKDLIKHPKSEEEFEQILKSGKPVLVDFFAEWCGPCQMMGPMLEEMSESYKNIDKIIIAKVDIDVLRNVAIKYDIMSVPTFIIFDEEGKPAETMIGMRPTEDFETKLDAILDNTKK